MSETSVNIALALSFESYEWGVRLKHIEKSKS